MKRKKDRSGKVAVIASMVVILLVGVSVFSLYSLSGNSILELAGLISGSSESTGTGKLLTRYDGEQSYAEDQIRVAETQEDHDISSDAETSGRDQVIVPETDGIDPIETKDEEAVPTSGAEDQAASGISEDPVIAQTVDTELIVNDSIIPEEVILGIAEDVSGTALGGTGTVNRGIDLTEPAAAFAEAAGTGAAAETGIEAVAGDDSAWQDDTEERIDPTDSYTTVVEADVDVEDDIDGDVEEEPVSVARSYTAAVVTEAEEEEDEWIYDYDLDEWVYAEDLYAAAEETNAEDDNTDDADEGEWIYDYDLDDWVYVEHVAEEADREADEETVEGEWIYDYDLDEWVYVEHVAEEEDREEDEEIVEGEWIYDYDLDEWVYVEHVTEEEDREEDEEIVEGEWIYDYDLDEWVYVEKAADEETEDKEKEDDDDSIEPEGEWIFDEDSEEWIYVDRDSAGEADTEEEEEEQTSLGQQIVDYAMGYVGVTPYVWGGSSLTTGTDCSGFVQLIFDHFGIYASHASMSYDGSEFGTVIGLDELQVGDIVVYGGGEHVAIYAGNGYVVHCSSPRNGTVYWDMTYRSDASWGLRIL